MRNVPDYIRLLALLLVDDEYRFGKGNNFAIGFENSHYGQGRLTMREPYLDDERDALCCG